MAKYNYWGYRGDWIKPPRREVRFLAFCNKSTFLRTQDPNYKGNCVKGRMAPTGNHQEIEIINKHPDKMVVVDWRTYEILEVRNLNRR